MGKKNNGGTLVKIKKGQVWRCKNKNYCIEVGKKLCDDFWSVHPHGNKVTVHRMQENSFHFYELVQEV